MLLYIILAVSLSDITNAIDWLCTEKYEKEQQNIGVKWAEHATLKNENLKTDISQAVFDASIAYDIDPAIILSTMWIESRLDNKVARLKKTGLRGELGLMQILPKGVCSQKCDLSNVNGQIMCGAKCLKMNIDACNGSVLYGISRYKSGGKCMATKAGKQRYKLYKILQKVLKYGKEECH